MKVLLLLAIALPFIAGQVITGGLHPYNADLTDANVVFAVNGINELFKTNGDARPRVAEKVVSATSQVVAGVIYKFKIEVSGGDAKELCSVAVWSRPWVNGEDSTQIQGTPSCVVEAIASSRQLAGGQVDVSFSDADVQKAVQFLESKLNAKSNSLYYLKATGASKITKQVVNGVIYRFYVVYYALSTCTQNDVKQNANVVCTVSDNAPVQETCSSEVYYNPREAEAYSLTSDRCNPVA